MGLTQVNALLRWARLESEYNSMVQFITADIHEWPFGSGYLHACKVDRTLQHVEGPTLVLREMFRTVSPWGVAAAVKYARTLLAGCTGLYFEA